MYYFEWERKQKPSQPAFNTFLKLKNNIVLSTPAFVPIKSYSKPIRSISLYQNNNIPEVCLAQPLSRQACFLKPQRLIQATKIRLLVASPTWLSFRRRGKASATFGEGRARATERKVFFL